MQRLEWFIDQQDVVGVLQQRLADGFLRLTKLLKVTNVARGFLSGVLLF